MQKASRSNDTHARRRDATYALAVSIHGRRFAIVALTVLAVGYAMCSSSRAAPLPPDLCGGVSPLSQGTKEIFCQATADLGEKSMLIAGLDEVVYRLVALPSFKNPFVLTIRQRRDGTGELTVRRRNASHSVVSLNAKLSLKELNAVRAQVTAAKFLALPTIADYSLNPDDEEDAKKRGEVVVCGDGTVWILEAWSREGYHLSYASCAPYQQFNALATKIAGLARQKFPRAQLEWDR